MPVSSATRARQLSAAQAAMAKAWGYDWMEHPKAKNLYMGLVNALDEHGPALIGKHLNVWKKEATSQVSRFKASENDIRRVTGPGLPANRKGAAPAVPGAPPQTAREAEGRAAVAEEQVEYQAARRTGKGRQSMNVFGVQTALPKSRRVRTAVEPDASGEVRTFCSGVNAQTTPLTAQKSGAELEALGTMPPYPHTVLENVGGSSGPVTDVGVATYRTGQQPRASHL